MLIMFIFVYLNIMAMYITYMYISRRQLVSHSDFNEIYFWSIYLQLSRCMRELHCRKGTCL